jgi:hypothetical protein
MEKLWGSTTQFVRLTRSRHNLGMLNDTDEAVNAVRAALRSCARDAAIWAATAVKFAQLVTTFKNGPFAAAAANNAEVWSSRVYTFKAATLRADGDLGNVRAARARAFAFRAAAETARSYALKAAAEAAQVEAKDAKDEADTAYVAVRYFDINAASAAKDVSAVAEARATKTAADDAVIAWQNHAAVFKLAAAMADEVSKSYVAKALKANLNADGGDVGIHTDTTEADAAFSAAADEAAAWDATIAAKGANSAVIARRAVRAAAWANLAAAWAEARTATSIAYADVDI